MKDFVKHVIDENAKAQSFLYAQSEKLYQITDIIYERLSKGNKLLIFGNGGSAADAQHITGELIGRFKKERRGLAAIALTTDSSVLTAWSNDYDFSRVFERQIEALARPFDILWAISTSGNSPNVIKAFEKGRELETYNFSLTGRDGGKLKEISDMNINIPLYDTPRIQEAHEVAYHIICELLESKF